MIVQVKRAILKEDSSMCRKDTKKITVPTFLSLKHNCLSEVNRQSVVLPLDRNTWTLVYVKYIIYSFIIYIFPFWVEIINDISLGTKCIILICYYFLKLVYFERKNMFNYKYVICNM